MSSRHQVDINGDGDLSIDELRRALAIAGCERVLDADAVMLAADKDHTGSIDLYEVPPMWAIATPPPPETLFNFDQRSDMPTSTASYLDHSSRFFRSVEVHFASLDQ